jgi:hypothetical protein
MPPYQPVSKAEWNNVHGPRPGTVVLQDVILRHAATAWGPGSAWSDGIYNHRMVRGSRTTYSLHSAGRACDIGLPQNATGKQHGDELFLRLINAADACGIVEVIWYRQRWSMDKGVVAYHGTDPHTGHVHFAQSVDMASRVDQGGDLHKWFDHFLWG